MQIEKKEGLSDGNLAFKGRSNLTIMIRYGSIVVDQASEEEEEEEQVEVEQQQNYKKKELLFDIESGGGGSLDTTATTATTLAHCLCESCRSFLCESCRYGSSSTDYDDGLMMKNGCVGYQSQEDGSQQQSQEKEKEKECEVYLKSTILERAFPERLLALLVTLMFEIPVLMMITGGSEQLCGLIGRRRYSLMMGFIPLTSAISGNVGLQASTLTTRAISHSHVTSRYGSYINWFLIEIGVAGYLGLAMGTILGCIAFIITEYDYIFSITIFIANVLSLITAGITGTFAPILFSFVFKRDSGKWGGPLETAIQDIVGSFAMVYISYKIISFLGPVDIDEWDMCGGVSSPSSQHYSTTATNV